MTGRLWEAFEAMLAIGLRRRRRCTGQYRAWRHCLQAYDEFLDIVEKGLDASPTSEVLIEESVLGWKEYEMEVVRDKADAASSSAPSRAVIQWACTRVTRSRWLRP